MHRWLWQPDCCLSRSASLLPFTGNRQLGKCLTLLLSLVTFPPIVFAADWLPGKPSLFPCLFSIGYFTVLQCLLWRISSPLEGQMCWTDGYCLAGIEYNYWLFSAHYTCWSTIRYVASFPVSTARFFYMPKKLAVETGNEANGYVCILLIRRYCIYPF